MPRRDLFFLFFLALIFNFALASFVSGPWYVDDAYYFGGALRLASGEGFTEPYLWNYLGNPTALPQPSHLYWMPLTSIIAALSMMAFGQSFAAARLPLILIASLLPLITYHCSLLTTGLRRHALAAGLLAIFCGFYAIYWGTTDSFALYAVVVSLTFVALWRGLEIGDWRLVIAAGACAGLAHLTRADGVLVLLLLVLWTIGQELFGGKGRSFVIRHSSSVVVGYLLVMLPWFIRNFIVAGSPFGVGGAGTLWLIEYNDIFNYPPNLTPARYFAADWSVILDGKLQSLISNLQTIVAVQGMIFLTPLIAIGLWQLRKHMLYRIVTLYAVLLYAAMTFAFSLPGMRGGLFHSGAALMPFYFPAALIGLDATIDWIAARLKHWKPEVAKRNFTVLVVALAATLTLALTIPRLSGSGEDSMFALLRDLPREAVVMSNNPPGVWVATGHPGIPLPNGDGDTVIALADQFNVRYIVMDQNITPGLIPLYENDGTEWLRLIRREGDVKLFEVIR
ncbi:MAG: glycosyltransferase family 39 protein [Chloroflexi bacterium]|nr:glycosyltransferase family 39 protein [Chloroflexota bacterium]